MKRYLAFLFLAIFVVNFCVIQAAAAQLHEDRQVDDRQLPEEERVQRERAAMLQQLLAPPTTEELREVREAGARMRHLQGLLQQQEREVRQVEEHKNVLINLRMDLMMGNILPDSGQSVGQAIEDLTTEIGAVEADETRLRAAIAQTVVQIVIA